MRYVGCRTGLMTESVAAATLAGLARASSPEERDLYLGLSVHRSEDGQDGQCL